MALMLENFIQSTFSKFCIIYLAQLHGWAIHISWSNAVCLFVYVRC